MACAMQGQLLSQAVFTKSSQFVVVKTAVPAIKNITTRWCHRRAHVKRASQGPFSFVIVLIYRSYDFPIFLLKSLLKGKIVRAPSLKTPFLETKEKLPYRGPYRIPDAWHISAGCSFPVPGTLSDAVGSAKVPCKSRKHGPFFLLR